MDYRHKLLEAANEAEFNNLLHMRTKALISQQGLPENRKSHLVLSDFEKEEAEVGFIIETAFVRTIFNETQITE